MRMRRTVWMLAGAMILGAVAGALGVRALSAQPEAEKRTVLVTTDLVDIQGYEVRIWRTDIGPGVVGAKHYHPGTECNYVLEGALILEKEGESPINLKAGEAHCARPRQVLVPRNASQTAPYKSVVVMIAPKGQPLAVPVK
jgi:quercetin dioxygenase-like cupin family protein